MNSMKKFDVTNWTRRQAYETFMRYSFPVFSLSTRLDVTNLYDMSKANNTSFFGEMLYIVSCTLNEIEEFKLRLYNGEVVIYDKIDPNYLVMTDLGAITPCRTNYTPNHNKFLAQEQADITKTRKMEITKKIFNVPGVVDCFYVSCMPWVDIVSVSNPYNFEDMDNCSIPRVTWGKFVNENDRKKMTIDIAAHHALIDGEPICRAFKQMQQKLDALK